MEHLVACRPLLATRCSRPSASTVGRVKVNSSRLLLNVVGSAAQRLNLRYDCGAAQAALRISRVVSDVVRAHGVAGDWSQVGAMARFE